MSKFSFPAPALNTPADAALLTDTTPDLTWIAVPGAATYTVQIATDALFASIVAEDTAVVGTTYTPSALAASNVYYWRVKANPNGAWSEVRSFDFVTLKTVLETLYTRATNVGAYYPMDDSAADLNLLTDNILYTAAAGSELQTGNAASDNATELDAATNFSGTGATVASQSSEVAIGTYALIITSTQDGSADRADRTINGLVAGSTYRVAHRRKAGTGVGQRLQSWTNLIAFDNVGMFNDQPTTSWAQRINHLVATSTSSVFRFYAADNGVVGGILYIDDFSVTKVGELDAARSVAGVTAQAAGPDSLQAMDFNGSTGTLTVPNVASIQGLTAATILLRIDADAVGTNDRLVFKSGEWDIYFNASGQLVAHRDYATTDAESITTAAIPITDTHIVITLSSVDNLIRIYLDGAEAAYGTQTAGVGAVVSNTNNWLWFNDGSSNGFDGKALRCALFAATATADEAAILYGRRNQTASFP